MSISAVQFRMQRPVAPFLRRTDSNNSLDEDTLELHKAVYPFELKEAGNAFFREGKYKEACELWLESVKEALKRSVRQPSAALWHNQVTCRLNLAMGYLKQGEWVEAKEQAELVLEQKPTNAKALYRLALALEKLEDWSTCRKLLDGLEHEAHRGEEALRMNRPLTPSLPAPPTLEELMKSMNTATANHDLRAPNELDAKENASSEAASDDESDEVNLQTVLDLAGFQPDELLRLCYDMRNRLNRAEKSYQQSSRKLLAGIGKKLDQIGGSEGREKASEVTIDKVDASQTEEELDRSMKDDFVDIVDLKKTVQWRHASTADEDSEDNAAISPNETSIPLNPHATPILRNAADDDVAVDDPNSDLWKEPYDVARLKKDRRALYLSLPLTLTYMLQKLTARDKDLEHRMWQETCSGATISANPSMFTLRDLSEDSKHAKVQRRLLRAIHRHRSLVVILIGVRGDVEMECQWTAVLKRVPRLRNLTLICVGFNDADDKWGKSLREGVLSPPLAKSAGLSGGKKLVCRLFKGLFQLFQHEFPTVLTDKMHPYHPDLVLIAEPRLARYFDTYAPVLENLIRHEIPTIVTGYSAVGQATHDAQNMPAVIKALGGSFVAPLQPNPYAVPVIPEKDCPPMKLWAGKDGEAEDFLGVSAKNAVVGCIMGFESEEPPVPIDDFSPLKEKLTFVCDVDSEQRALLEMSSQQSEGQLKDPQLKQGQLINQSEKPQHSNVETTSTETAVSSSTGAVSPRMKAARHID